MSKAKPSVAKKIAVIGAGWAGCAAAVELARSGHHVTLYEAARTLGGRARRVELDGKALDNGQHILLGAYTESLRLMRLVGIDTNQAILRLPLQMRYPENSGGMDFLARRLPAPLHLLAALWQATGLTRQDKLALARFSTSARWIEWKLNIDCSVSELLDRFDQTDCLNKLLWRPLCLAALNTPPERASAQIFLNILRDSLGARRAASDMLIPKVDLSALFPLHAGRYVEQRGGNVQYGATVKTVQRSSTGWQLEVTGGPDTPSAPSAFDALVIATQASHASGLLENLMEVKQLTSFQYEPITTCYLQYSFGLRLQQPFFALADAPGENEWAQFVFDRGQLDPKQAGLLAVVISASTESIAIGHQALTDAIAMQLAKALQLPELAAPLWTKMITEKRATYSCTPALMRPDNASGIAGLFIAGDYTDGDYPATLESAVRSGVRAAQLAMR